MSRVDVIVPCYRYAHYLRACVESVLRQTGVEVRVLIIDDASPDDTPAVGTALAGEDSRVEYRRHAVNRGHIRTYTEGIDWLSADYCLLLSADDMLTPGALARAAAVMDRHPEVGLTYGMAIVTDRPDPERDVVIVTPEVRVRGLEDFLGETCERGHNLVPTPTAIGRTSVQKAIGYYRPDLTHSGDTEMWLRYAAHSSVAFIRSHQAYYRIHGANMSIGYRGVKELHQTKLALDSLFDRHGGRIAGGAELRRVFNRKIGREAFDGAHEAFERGDTKSCAELARFAHEVDPPTRFARRWLRLRGKRLLGPSVCSWLRSRLGRQRV